MNTQNFTQCIIILLFSIMVPLTGCSVPKEARTSAALMSSYTVQLQEQLKTFSDSRLSIEKDRRRVLNRWDEEVLEQRQTNQQELEIWAMTQLGTKKKDYRVALFEAIQQGYDKATEQYQAMEIMRTERAKSVQETESAVQYGAKKLASVSKALAALSKKSDFKTQTKFFIAVAKETRESIKTLEEESKSLAKDAKTNSEELLNKK